MARDTRSQYPLMNRWWGCLLCTFVLVSGCTDTGKSAPPGDHAALEQLADAYRTIAEGLPSNPLNQPPEDRRRFVDAVFREAGYDYAATLKQLGQGGLDPAQALHRDLAQLILLPTSGLAREDIEKIYSTQELAAVEKIEEALR